jgi:hypothetical protein
MDRKRKRMSLRSWEVVGMPTNPLDVQANCANSTAVLGMERKVCRSEAACRELNADMDVQEFTKLTNLSTHLSRKIRPLLKDFELQFLLLPSVPSYRKFEHSVYTNICLKLYRPAMKDSAS